MLPYSESYPEETKYIKEKKLPNLPIFLYSLILLKKIAFENVYESSMIFQSVLYAKIPTESSP